MRRSVVVLAYPGVQSLDIVGPFDVFAGASQLLGADQGYDITLVSVDGAPVRAGTGLEFVTQSLPDPRTPTDTVVLPGGFSVETAAARLGVTRHTVYNYLDKAR